MKVSTLAGVLIAAAVIVVAIVGFHRGWFAPPPRPALNDPLIKIAPDNVAELVIAAEGKPQIRLWSNDDQWHMLSPIRGRADDQQVQRLIQALLDMRIAQTYTPSDPRRPAIKATGLDVPRAVFRITSRGGVTHTIRIGTHPAWVEDTYVQEEGLSDVLLARPDPTAELTRPFIDYRAAALLAMDRARLQRVTVGGAHAFELTRPLDTWWLGVGDVTGALAEAGRVEALIAALETVQITGITPAPAAELKAFGLEPPTVSFILGFAPGPAPPEAASNGDPTGPDVIAVAFGSRDGVVYAILEGSPWLMTIDPQALQPLLVDAESLRDRRVLHVPVDAIDQVTLDRDPVATVFTRRNGRWTADGAVGVDSAAIDGLLTELTGPNVTDFIAGYSTLAGFGLDTPPLRISCDAAGVTYTILIGDVDSQGRVYVKQSDDPTVMMVHAPHLAAATRRP